MTFNTRVWLDLRIQSELSKINPVWIPPDRNHDKKNQESWPGRWQDENIRYFRRIKLMYIKQKKRCLPKT